MTVATTDERVAHIQGLQRLYVEYPDVALFLATYWPADDSDDAAALHAILRGGCGDGVARWRRRIMGLLLTPVDDADKAAFVRAATRRRFPVQGPVDIVTWLGGIAMALLEIEDYLAP